MPLSRGLLALLLALAGVPAAAHPGHKAPAGHVHVYAAPAPQAGGTSATVEMGACVGDGKAEAEPAPGPAHDKWLAEPFDAAHERLPADVWIGLVQEGVRLDETTCHLVQRTDIKSRAELRAYREGARRSNELIAVESLRAMLAKADPNAPLPPALKERLAQIESSQLALPAGLKGKLEKAGTVKDALAAIDLAHAESTLFFDGQVKLEDRVKNAMPLAGWNAPNRPDAYAGDAEARLGKLLQTDIETMFRGLPPGAELMDRFKGSDGKTHLPKVQILKLSQRPDDPGYGNAWAVFSPYTNAVVLNHWSVANAALNAAPEAERAKLRKDFADPGKLAAYLEAHPETRRAFLDSQDIVLFHELTHAWQDRRTKLDLEMLRGNVAGLNPLEKEHEAFRSEFAYFHAKLLKEPEKAMKSDQLDGYINLLASYDGFRDDVTRMYMNGFGGSSDAPTMEQIQKDRASLAYKLARTSAGQWIDQALKVVGMRWGSAALGDFKRDMDARTKEFTEKTWPAMRKEGFAKLLTEYEKQGRYDRALLVADASNGGVGAGRRATLLELTEESLRRRKGDIAQRLDAWGAVESARLKDKKPLPPDLRALEQADYREYVQAWIAVAKAEPARRKEALATARQYVTRIEKRDDLLKELDRLEKQKAKK